MGETAEEQAEMPAEGPAPLPVEEADLKAALVMGVLFVGSILVAMLFAQTFVAQDVPPVFEDTQDPTNSLLYLGIVVVFTVVILAIAKLGFKKIIQWVILGAVFFTIVYVLEPLLGAYLPTLAQAGPAGMAWSSWISLAIAVGLTTALYVYPEWYVVDATGVTVAAGATGIFGFSFGLFPALVLLVGFALYDFIAVYRTKHMLDLADNVMELRLPIMLVVPKSADYSFLQGDRLTPGPGGATVDKPPWEVTRDVQTGQLDTSRDALFMGLGDIVIPGVLVVSAFMFLDPTVASSVFGLTPNLFVALATLVGATVGFFFLMRGVLKGTAHAGLPALNGGALVFFLAATLWLYGVDPLIPVF